MLMQLSEIHGAGRIKNTWREQSVCSINICFYLVLVDVTKPCRYKFRFMLIKMFSDWLRLIDIPALNALEEMKKILQQILLARKFLY